MHIHVRDPETGGPSRDPALFREVVERIRRPSVDVVLNLTAGMGGDLVLGGIEKPLPPNEEGTDMAGATERLAHVAELLPEICTLDCGTMNFAEGDYVMTNTPSMLREMARQVQELGVRPEIEVFDTGHLVFAKQLIAEGLIDEPALLQLCMGIPYGAPADPGTLLALVNQLPDGCVFSAFAIGRMQLAVRRARAARRRQRARRARGQHLARAWRQGDERAARRASGDDPRGDERPRARAGGDAREARPHAPRCESRGRRGRRDRRRLGRPARRERRRRERVTTRIPRPSAGVQEVLDNAERAWAQLTLAPRARGVAISFVSSLEEAVHDAEVIQESAPEDEALKRRLLPRSRITLDRRPSSARRLPGSCPPACRRI